MLHTKPPKCPIHVSATMVRANSKEPLFVFVSIHNKRHHQSARKKQADERMIWQCPIPGCPRVEAGDIVGPSGFRLAGSTPE